MEYQTQSDKKQTQQQHSQDEAEKQIYQNEQDSKSEDQEQEQDQDKGNSQEQQEDKVEDKEEDNEDGTETQQGNLEEQLKQQLQQILNQQQQQIEYEGEDEEEVEGKGSNMFFICLSILLIVLFVGTFYFRYQEQFFQKNQAMIYDKNYYDILEIQPDSSIESIKDSYKQLIKIWHPDLPQNKNCKKCLKKFMEIKQAYEILSDIKQKELYDSRAKINQIVNFKSQFLNKEMLESSEYLVIQVLVPECDQYCLQFNKL